MISIEKSKNRSPTGYAAAKNFSKNGVGESVPNIGPIRKIQYASEAEIITMFRSIVLLIHSVKFSFLDGSNNIPVKKRGYSDKYNPSAIEGKGDSFRTNSIYDQKISPRVYENNARAINPHPRARRLEIPLDCFAAKNNATVARRP
jgi:hypothetical protein